MRVGTGLPSRSYKQYKSDKYWSRWGEHWREAGFSEDEIVSLLIDNVAPSSPLGQLLSKTRKYKVNTYMKIRHLTFEKAVERANNVREAQALEHNYSKDHIWAELYSVDDETRRRYSRRQSNWEGRKTKRKSVTRRTKRQFHINR